MTEVTEGRAGGDPAAAVGDASLAALLAYWQGLREGERLPPRSAVDPTALPAELRPLLPHFFLYDVIRGRALDYRMRLAGSMLCASTAPVCCRDSRLVVPATPSSKSTSC